MKFRCIIAIGILFLISCTTTADYLSDFEIKEKTITVPPGNRGIIGDIKRSFRDNGYELFVHRGPTVTRGTIGSDTMIETGNTFLSNFTLYYSDRVIDTCLVDNMYTYDLSIVDNTTGKEVFTANGSDCAGAAADKIAEKLTRFW